MVKEEASAPDRLCVRVSPVSGSVAVTATPTAVPPAEFSGTSRLRGPTSSKEAGILATCLRVRV